jgi:hypothetical protein
MNSTILITSKSLLLILSLLLCLQACDTATPALETSQLEGSWLFEKGTIDGDSAMDLLKGLVFSFTETEFNNELLGDMMPGFSTTEPYVIEEKTVIVNEKFKLLVKEVDDQHLHVSFDVELGGAVKNFDLVFVKTE